MFDGGRCGAAQQVDGGARGVMRGGECDARSVDNAPCARRDYTLR